MERPRPVTTEHDCPPTPTTPRNPKHSIAALELSARCPIAMDRHATDLCNVLVASACSVNSRWQVDAASKQANDTVTLRKPDKFARSQNGGGHRTIP
jgi:hypothetical protein